MNLNKRLIGGLGVLTLVVACHKSDDMTGPSTPGATALSYVTAVAAGSASGTFNAGTVPAASAGPTLTVTSNTHVINGGTNLAAITSTASLSKIYVYVTGAAGYYEVVLPTPGTSANLVLSLATTLPTSTFELVYAGVNAGGAVGPASVVSTTVTTVGTGDVQVSLSWDAQSDLDLHVVEPSGEEVYWNNRLSATSGKIDLDSNQACILDGIRNENVVWPTGKAPRGTYTVRVDLWASCNTTSTNYVVRVGTGGTSNTYSGTLTGSGDQGGRGSGALVTTFTY